MIHIKKSPTADTLTCDWAKVTQTQLLTSSKQHIGDVVKGMLFFANNLLFIAMSHDKDKIDKIDHFHADFITGFAQTEWWDNHRKITRHHLSEEDGIPTDVNLIDVIEYRVDGVMAGMARSGSVYDIVLGDELLQQALKNTVELLKANVILDANGDE